MKKAIFKEYAELKMLEKDIASKIKALKPSVLEEMGDKLEVTSEYGVFLIKTTRKWTFPADIVKAQEELEAREIEAKQVGTATYVPNTVLEFREKSEPKFIDNE